MAELPTLKPKMKNGAWVLIIVFLGLIAVTGVLYYKHQRRTVTASQEVVQQVKPSKALELEACNDKTLALEAEVRRLQEQLKTLGQPLSVAAPTSQPKRVVEVKVKSLKPAQPQPAKDTSNAPQSSWNSTPVPAPILDWLQHD